MHFTRLILQDFQAHEKSVFELDKGLNVLVGLSNSGKSSVSRALQFILMGSPWDKSWVRFGVKCCKIILETDTGVIVERHKGEKINKYILTLPNQEPMQFDSFGTSVPEAVQQALNIHEVQINNTESLNLNVALQHDSLFLLSAVPSVRARILGKLSGADILDSSIQSINRDKRQLTAEKQSKELELVDLQTQIDKLATIEGFSEQITTIEQKLASLALAEQRVARIAELFRQVSILKGSWQRETVMQEILNQVDLNVIGQLAQRVDKIKQLSSLNSRIVDHEYTFKNILKQNELLGQIDLDSINQLEPRVARIGKLVTLSAKYNVWQGMYSIQNQINNLLTPVDISVISILAEKMSNLKRVRDLLAKINRNQVELSGKTGELKQVEQKYNEAKEQYSEMLRKNGVCPVCNQETSNL